MRGFSVVWSCAGARVEKGQSLRIVVRSKLGGTRRVRAWVGAKSGWPVGERVWKS